MLIQQMCSEPAKPTDSSLTQSDIGSVCVSTGLDVTASPTFVFYTSTHSAHIQISYRHAIKWSCPFKHSSPWRPPLWPPLRWPVAGRDREKGEIIQLGDPRNQITASPSSPGLCQLPRLPAAHGSEEISYQRVPFRGRSSYFWRED